MQLKDKVAIVTGGANGIGKAIVKCLSYEGAKVVIADKDIEAGKAIEDEIAEAEGESAAFELDIIDEKAVNDMVAEILARFGRIDILVNVAGGSKGRYIRDEFGPFAESTKEMWDRIIDINLNGARNCTRAVINHMIERKRGKIVSLSSLAGVQGAPNAVDYSAAKAGIIGFTKALAKEVAPLGIQVNCISPGGVATSRMRAFVEANSKTRSKASDRQLSLANMAQPNEIANIVLLLVSDRVSHIIGENIVVAGPDRV